MNIPLKIIPCFFIIIVLQFNHALGQSNKIIFAKIDNYAIKTPLSVTNDLDTLSNYLTKPYSNETEKIRSIFTWVAHNISYDCEKMLEIQRNQETGNKSIDSSQQSGHVLTDRMAVCEGYSNIFCELCKRSNISCEVITGFAKKDGVVSKTGHDWNAVKVANEWKLLDVTWSSGYVDPGNNKFSKKFNDEYFLLDADNFLTGHYPSDVMWQLEEHPVTKQEFKSGKIKGDSKTIFYYKDSINNYFKLDSSQKITTSYNRILRYDPSNRFTAVNLMIERMNQGCHQLNEGNNLYSQYVTIVNKAKMSRNPKPLNAQEIFLKKLLTESKNKMQAAQNIFLTVQFTDDSNLKLLQQNQNSANYNLSLIAAESGYLARFYKTWKPLRIFVL